MLIKNDVTVNKDNQRARDVWPVLKKAETTQISASLALLAVPVQHMYLLKHVVK